MIDRQIAEIRHFNRVVTQRVGALHDSFLGRDRPLGQSRVLYEIGVSGADLRELRQRLDLDSGYLSRLVQALEGAGLVQLTPTAADGRVHHAQLTDTGRAEVAEMNQRSDDGARAILAPLTVAQRQRLVGAMVDVRQLLMAASVRIQPTDADSDTARHCLREFEREVARRFAGGFDPSLSHPMRAGEFRGRHGTFLLAVVDGRPVGCGGLTTTSPGVGSIKRMWVSREARGLGIGRRLLEALETAARSRGLSVLRLETNDALHEALALYRAAGYSAVTPFNTERYADHWLEKPLDDTHATPRVSRHESQS
jgi:DNA-binding MarR family transcriptional regulator/GNAT superfamily N-acetyltransferase